MPQKDGKGKIDPIRGIQNEGKVDTNEQSEKDRATVAMVEKLFTRYKQHRMAYDKNWVENYKMFRGKQWKEARPAYRNDDVINYIHATIQAVVPIMTDSQPNIEAVPENPSDFEFAEILTQLLTSKWDKDQYNQVVAEAIVDSLIYGTAISEQPWNPNKADGLGDYDFKTVDPMYCYPDPRARDINDENGFGFITAIPTDLAEVKRKYPDVADLIKSDLADIDRIKTAKMEMDDYRIRSATDNLTLVQGERPADDVQSDQVLVITAYLKDETLTEEKILEKDEKGKAKTKYRQRKKYPNGRKIVIANKILCYDEENEYVDGKIPFCRLVDHIIPREFWGEGEVDQLKGPQQMINKLVNYGMDVISLMGNPVWKNPTGSGVFSDSIVNRPGLVIDYNDGYEPRRERGEDIQGSLFALLDRLENMFERVSGVNEVSIGAEPRNASGIAIDSLREAAQTRIRLKSRNVQAWLTQVGQQMASRLLQFYTIPRVIRITDNQGASKYFEIAIDSDFDESGEEQYKVATFRQMEQQVDPETGEQVMVQSPVQQYEIKGNLDIRITTGSALPFAKAQKKLEAKELYQLGIYDEEDLLEDLEHPRATVVLEKLAQRKAQAAQAEQAAMMGQQQGQPQAPMDPSMQQMPGQMPA